MPTYLVTGGAGFIGSHLVVSLVKLGHRVKVLDNFITGKKENLADVKNLFELIDGDIRDENSVDRAVMGVDFILHEAALRTAPLSILQPKEYTDVNIRGTVNILEAARKHKVKRVVYASSSAVYGDTEVLPQHEALTPKPQSPYGLTKLVGEYYCRLYTELHGLSTVSLRYFNVFGERQDLESQYAVVIPKFVVCILKGESPPIYGDGLQSRDFVHVANAVQANLLACQAAEIKSEVFNIAGGIRHTILELVSDINKISGKNIKPVFKETRSGDPKHSWADISKAKKILKYEEKVSFTEGLERTLHWLKSRAL